MGLACRSAMFAPVRGSDAAVSAVDEFLYMFSTSHHSLPAVRGIGSCIYLILQSELLHVLDGCFPRPDA